MLITSHAASSDVEYASMLAISQFPLRRNASERGQGITKYYQFHPAHEHAA